MGKIWSFGGHLGFFGPPVVNEDLGNISISLKNIHPWALDTGQLFSVSSHLLGAVFSLLLLNKDVNRIYQRDTD